MSALNDRVIVKDVINIIKAVNIIPVVKSLVLFDQATYDYMLLWIQHI